MVSPYTLLCVSEASRGFRLHPAIDEIVERSVRRNHSVGITGVLIYSGGYFSQYLEGMQHDVDALVDRIRADPRHHSLRVMNTAIRSERLCSEWSLAYAGDAGFVQKEVTRLFAAAQNASFRTSASMRMIDLMQDFIAMRGKRGPTIH
ncbi:BLUF domain-containing protein [Rhizorhabdus argentea]|uniref:BLUF domain-containing protein n=1 Tax=Rhizorhabdus argentea TaxID=1387174 RepID=UPI0030ECF8E1